jgi:3'-phosphoadenosine 5'-phosphosulfate sulfotransferase (PAPS reductase)/FAD synthetase
MRANGCSCGWFAFGTLGCYPLTGAIESSAATLEDIAAEMRNARVSERQGAPDR